MALFPTPNPPTPGAVAPGTATPPFSPQQPTLATGGLAGGMEANSAPQPQPASQPPPATRSPEEEAARQQQQAFSSYRDQLNAFLSDANIASRLPDEMLTEIGQRVVEGYDIDLQSRRDWEDTIKEAIDLARMVGKVKMYGEGAVANVKYPTLAIAAIQFAARAYPNIINGESVVKGKKVGVDADGAKQKRATRMATFMSWQLLEDMDGWDEETDQLLVTLPLVGCVFRKTYRDGVNERNASKIVWAENLIINYFSRWDSTTRMTEVVPLYPNEVVERVRSGRFLDVELGQPTPAPHVIQQNQDSRDPDLPHFFLEQHCWWDIDGDGYQEPYIITVHKDTQQVVRIVARFDIDGIHTNDKGLISRIEPVSYYTRYLFFPAFDGGIYGMGFGSLIGGMNRTINTNLNQLLDAGTLSNRQCGFIAKGIRLPEGAKALKFRQGEWKFVDTTGDDLRKGVFPLPTLPPSDVLFKLMSFMVEASEKLASNADMLSGMQPQANTPATTTLALIEQGLKVYSSIYLRVHKSLKAEYKKLKRLNRLFLDNDLYQRVLDDPEADVGDFYDSDLDVTPVSDVADLNDMQKIMKAQALKELLGLGLNDQAILSRYLEALNIPDRQELLTVGEAKVDPKVQIQQMKSQIEETKAALKQKELELKAQTDSVKAAKTQADTDLVAERAKSQQFQREIDALRFELDRERQQLEAIRLHGEHVQKRHDRAMGVVDAAHRQEVDARKLEIEDKKASQKPAPTTPAKRKG